MHTFLIKFHITNKKVLIELLAFITQSNHLKIDDECYVVSSDQSLRDVYGHFQQQLFQKRNKNDLLFFVPCEYCVYFYSLSEAARKWMGEVLPRPSIDPG